MTTSAVMSGSLIRDPGREPGPRAGWDLRLIRADSLHHFQFARGEQPEIDRRGAARRGGGRFADLVR
jgi:hypothetical protein